MFSDLPRQISSLGGSNSVFSVLSLGQASPELNLLISYKSFLKFSFCDILFKAVSIYRGFDLLPNDNRGDVDVVNGFVKPKVTATGL